MLPLLQVIQGVRILAVNTPADASRAQARALVRQAIREDFAAGVGVDAGSLALLSSPGAPPCLGPPWQQVGVSISHEAGLSLAAIRREGAVGIDLLRLGPLLEDLDDLDALASDYLGPEAVRALGALPAGERPLAFAQAWARHEARLKCRGLDLQEWTPELAARLRTLTVIDLAMPAGWVAALAIG